MHSLRQLWLLIGRGQPNLENQNRSFVTTPSNQPTRQTLWLSSGLNPTKLCPTFELMIESVAFKYGRTKDAPKLQFKPGAMTVLIGPNNSGKTKALSEICYRCALDGPVDSDAIIDQILFAPISEERLDEMIRAVGGNPNEVQGYASPHGRIVSQSSNTIERSHLIQLVVRPLPASV
jgi:hypothetical protein